MVTSWRKDEDGIYGHNRGSLASSCRRCLLQRRWLFAAIVVRETSTRYGNKASPSREFSTSARIRGRILGNLDCSSKTRENYAKSRTFVNRGVVQSITCSDSWLCSTRHTHGWTCSETTLLNEFEKERKGTLTIIDGETRMI